LINTTRGEDMHGQMIFIFWKGSCFIYGICIYFGISVSNTIYISDDVRIV